MKCLKIQSMKFPEVVELPKNGLLNAIYSEINCSTFECVYPWKDSVCLICDEEGKYKENQEFNRSLFDANDEFMDAIFGTFLIVGIAGEEFTDLTEQQIGKYSEMFHFPELMMVVNDVFVIQYLSGRKTLVLG